MQVHLEGLRILLQGIVARHLPRHAGDEHIGARRGNVGERLAGRAAGVRKRHQRQPVLHGGGQVVGVRTQLQQGQHNLWEEKNGRKLRED